VTRAEKIHRLSRRIYDVALLAEGFELTEHATGIERLARNLLAEAIKAGLKPEAHEHDFEDDYFDDAE